MERLNKKQVYDLINQIKIKVNERDFKINVFRAVKEFLLKYIDEIYIYRAGIYVISDKWLYDIDKPKSVDPMPGKGLFCAFCDSNDDTYHYWLANKKIISKYGITYNDFKNFHSINWFETSDNQLYINNKFYTLAKA